MCLYYTIYNSTNILYAVIPSYSSLSLLQFVFPKKKIQKKIIAPM
jgi:hypothetical protein